MEPTFHLNNGFRACLHNLMQYGLTSSPRGSETKELINYNITLVDPRNRVITFPERKTSTRYLLGEFIWYLTGSNDVAGILPFAKFWDSLRNSGNEAGYAKDTINSNYGTRFFGLSNLPALTRKQSSLSPGVKLNQWKETLDILSNDKDSRQAVMNIHVPSDRHDGNKDVPCTLTLQWFIRAGRLHLIVNMRSNDVILGFTNDVFQFTMLQEAMLVQLREVYPELQLGHYYHNAGSMHIYERHFDMAEKIVANPRAMDITMIPMDVFDELTILNLIHLQEEWVKAGMPEEFDFSAWEAFKSLSPYWQALVKAFFLSDDEAMHFIFGQSDVNA